MIPGLLLASFITRLLVLAIVIVADCERLTQIVCFLAFDVVRPIRVESFSYVFLFAFFGICFAINWSVGY